MQEQIDKLLIKIDYLEKTVNTQQQYLILTWTSIGVCVAIIGIALYFLVKMWFSSRFEREIKKIDNKIKTFVIENPQILHANGVCSLLSQDFKEGKWEYLIKGLLNFKKDNIIYYDIYYLEDNKKISINYNQIEISNDGFKIILIDKDKLTYCQNLNLNFVVLWKNQLYSK